MKIKINNKKIMHYTLNLILLVGLGLLLSLVFSIVAYKDIFYLYNSNITMKINGTYTLDIFDSSKVNKEKLTWYAENPEIVTVDDNGNLSAHNLGKTRIIVKSRLGLFKRSVDIKVSNFTIYSIVFEENKKILKVGDKEKLTPVLNGDSNIKSNLGWRSSDSNIVSVSSNGEINALNNGTATIVATDKYTGLSTSVNIIVTNEEDEEPVVLIEEDSSDSEEEEIIAVENIKLNTNKLNLYIGDVRKISSIVTPDNATDKTLIYTSTDSNVASVNKYGYVTARGKGVCNISVTNIDGDVEALMTIKVIDKKVHVENISLTQSKIDLDKGESYLIEPNIFPTNASDKDIAYSSSNNDVASVDNNGKVLAHKKGTATIVAITKDGKKTASLIVNVSNKIKEKESINVEINNFKSSMLVGEENKIEVIPSKDIKINMTTSDHDVARITQDGKVKALEPGIVYIEFESMDGGYHYKEMMTVLPGEVDAEIIYVNKRVSQLLIGEQDTLVATVMPENASSKELIWTSSNPAIASVDQNGIVTANGVGTATIIIEVKNSGVKRNVKIGVVAKESLIDLRKKVLVPYYIKFKLYDKGTTTWKSMQNFAIANIGTAKEIIYISFPTRSTIPRTEKLTKENKKAASRTTIVQIPRSEINKPTSTKRKYMYLNWSGHAQAFDLDCNSAYIWTNGNGTAVATSKKSYSGYHTSLVKVKYKPNNINSKYKPSKTIKINKIGGVYPNTEIAFDWPNNLAAVRASNKVFIYRASDFTNGKLTLLYSFNLVSRSADGTNYVGQGHDIANGYYYHYRGYVGTKMYIEVYNYVGELQYTKIFDPKLPKQEAEGLKIYNDKVYVGVTNTCKGCQGKLNNIYFFK